MKKKANLAATVLIATMLLTAVVVAGGCGSSTRSSGTQPAKSEETTQQGQVNGNTQAASSQQSSSTSSSTSSGSGSDDDSDAGVVYSFDSQQVGSGFPPELLKVVDVRWSDHGSYFRIVFDVKKLDGSDSSYVPQCGVGYAVDHTSLSLYIVGTSVTDPAFSTIGSYVSIGDTVVDSMAQVMPAGSGEATFGIHLTAPHGCHLSYATGPLRFIVDIDK
jgi:hypothetical protein